MRVGVLGGGQLARMMALAGHPLGITCTVLDPAADACAGAVAELIVGATSVTLIVTAWTLFAPDGSLAFTLIE